MLTILAYICSIKPSDNTACGFYLHSKFVFVQQKKKQNSPDENVSFILPYIACVWTVWKQ